MKRTIQLLAIAGCIVLSIYFRVKHLNAIARAFRKIPPKTEACKKKGENDYSKTSGNIESFLKSDKEYPLIGFWKHKCSDEWGLAIDKATEGRYLVVFCGPGGCGSWECANPIDLAKDESYRAVDSNTISVNGSPEHRCGGPKG